MTLVLLLDLCIHKVTRLLLDLPQESDIFRVCPHTEVLQHGIILKALKKTAIYHGQACDLGPEINSSL